MNLGHVMNIFDKQDEDDDFRCVDYNIRKEISSIGSLINESLRNGRFLMIFHSEVKVMDLVKCGIPVFGKGALLCSNEGRFCIETDYESTSIFPLMYVRMDYLGVATDTQLHHILHILAVGVISDTGIDDISPERVLDCFLYTFFLAAQQQDVGVDYDWATYACNYWISDGIIEGDKAWEIGNILYGVIPQLGDYEHIGLLSSLFNGRKSYKGWFKFSCKKQRGDYIPKVHRRSSSYFLSFQDHNPVYLHGDVFHFANNLRVLKLSNCSFDFASPPFQLCENLRFLWLVRCRNTGKEQSGALIFPNLLVFDLRFTYYVCLAQTVELMTNLRELNTKGVSWKTMSHVWEKLHKLQKLRLTEYSDVVTVDNCSSIDMMNLELLDLSGNSCMESLPILSSARRLKMLVLDGCSSLENVVLAMERAPPLLERFSFDGDQIKDALVTKISLDGCDRLHTIFLHALPNLEELNLSDTAIKTLDFDGMDVPKLKKLFLLGCQQLRSIIWHGPKLEVLHVDTRGKKRSMVCCGGQGSFGFHAFIAFTDGRFTWSYIGAILYFCTWKCLSKVYLLISCMSHCQANITKNIKEMGSSQEGFVPTSKLLPYNNISLTKDVTCSSFFWNHQQLQTLDVHIEIGEGSYNLESMQDTENFTSFLGHVESFHVHDNSSITAISPVGGAHWKNLEWCQIERCPKLHSVFSCPDVDGNFECMKIFSASDLLVVYCIWNRGINNIPSSASYLQQLQHIYLYNCPKLVFVLPISFTLPNLETLQIAYCSSLRHVFPLDEKYPPAISSGVTFKNLKHIKLYHLHKLEQICEARLTVPALQTIDLRDCWVLRRLPAVARQGPKPVVDCEKDWWNMLEWDGLDVGHDQSLFETRHSTYYKKTLPRVSFLR